MIKEAINTLVSGNSLSFEEARQTMTEIMDGQATQAQIASLVTALRMKGETPEEIAGLASVMREKAMPVAVSGPAIDIVGTGGDGSGSFNISTAAAFVAAGAGLKVAKHGNRAATSQSGSADILEALGVKIDLSPASVATCIKEAGIGFLFAPLFHPAMKYAAGPRKEIGIRTVFNILGPLTNPAKVQYMVLGVASRELGSKIASVLQRLGTEHSLVVHGSIGLDEVSVCGSTLIWDVKKDRVSPPYEVFPGEFGFNEASLADIKGSTPAANADTLRQIFSGKKGAIYDAVVMNAAAALVAGDIVASFKEGTRLAAESIDSGKAKEKLEQLVSISQSLGE
jgi:anthranilate phosphoribosyltransferase